MRHFAVMCAITTLSGCMLLSASGGSDDRGGKHNLTINFHLKGPGGVAVPCSAGFKDLLLSATTDEATGQLQTFVPCQSSGSATMELYTKGERRYMKDGDSSTYSESFTENYHFVLYLTDPTGEVVRAESLTTHLKLDNDKTIDVDLYPDAGILLFSWELWSGITTDLVHSCAAVGLDEIELKYRLFTFAGDPPAPSASVRWPCDERHPPYYISDESSGQGFLPALAPADYLGVIIGYRNGVAVPSMGDEVGFKIESGNHLTERGGSLTVADR